MPCDWCTVAVRRDLPATVVTAMKDTVEQPIRFGRIAAMLPVADMKRATDFYIGVLGFENVFENGNPVGFMILEKDGAELHLTLQPDHKAPAFNVAHMMVENVDALHELIQGQGLRIIKRLQDKDYGLRAFVFADPDGNRIDVGQPI
jgi:catechol 2,3-dioxygenase-like lactoylglutathione lyase family enzyme